MHYVERPEYSDEPNNFTIPLANICGYKVFAGKQWTGYYLPKMEITFASEQEAQRANLAFGFANTEAPFSLRSERVGKVISLTIEYIGQIEYGVRQKMIIYYNGAEIGWFWIYPSLAEGEIRWNDYKTRFQIGSIGSVVKVETSIEQFIEQTGPLTLDRLESKSASMYYEWFLEEGVCKFVEPASVLAQLRTNGTRISFDEENGSCEIAGNGTEFYYYGDTTWQELISQEPTRTDVYGWIINLFSIQFFDKVTTDIELDDY